MVFNESFKYSFINKIDFDNKILNCKTDGSKYKNYIIVKYNDNDVIKRVDVPNEMYLNKYTNIIDKHNVEEIVSSCMYFDSMYEVLYYYHIDDIYFIKYKILNEELENMEDNSIEISKILNNL